MNVEQLLNTVITNAVPMGVVFWFLGRPGIEVFFLNNQQILELNLGISVSALKRYLAMILSVIISAICYYFYAKLGYTVMPNNVEAWGNLLIWLSSINFSGTQLLHSFTKKRMFV